MSAFADFKVASNNHKKPVESQQGSETQENQEIDRRRIFEIML